MSNKGQGFTSPTDEQIDAIVEAGAQQHREPLKTMPLSMFPEARIDALRSEIEHQGKRMGNLWAALGELSATVGALMKRVAQLEQEREQ